jgi:eukaryotic-like serine/threonine-protein kinase
MLARQLCSICTDSSTGGWDPHFDLLFRGPGLSLTGANLPFEIGSIVADKFRIERVLAEGGMGLVVAATHIQLEQTVALKFFRGDLRSSGEPLLRFMREAKAAAQIKSEYVARVLDVGVTDDGTPYMVMEYLEGHGLEKVIAAERRLDVSSAVEYAIQACEGLAEAHARGIVHRDIKPSNLFLTERSPGWRTIKILDFGISKVSLAQASNITTNLNLVMGTPCYMSPEQFQSAAGVDHRSDIWSLGCTLYEMLAGRPPFDPALPLLAMAEAIVKKDPTPLRELRPDIPQELSEVVVRSMAKDRERRIPSAAGLAIALLPFAPGRAGATAERAAAITPARDLREGAVHPLVPDAAEVAKSGMQWTQIGFASPTPSARQPLPPELTPTPPAPVTIPPVSTLSTGIAPPGAALVPLPLPPPEPEVPPSWQPRTSGIAIIAGLLVCGVIVLAFLRAAPGPRAPASPMTVAPVQLAAPAGAPSPAPAPASEGAAALSELIVRVSPPTAQIMVDGAMVSGNPFRGRFAGGMHQIQAFAAGYEPKIQQASLATDVVVDFSLERRSKATSSSSSSSSSASTSRSATALPRFAPPAAQARTPPAAQVGRLQQARELLPASRPTGSTAGLAPGIVPADIVDPRGGRSPLHPIETRSPYKGP